MISKKEKKSAFNTPHLYMRRPTFIDGLASNFDLYNAKSINPHSSILYDFFGMKSDFDMVGKDFHQAIRKLKKELTL